MKLIYAVALIALVALAAGAEAGKGGNKKVYASSKTFVTVEPGLHRFCIPVGKYAEGLPKDLSLHIPRRSSGLTVKLDSSPLNNFANTPASDKDCKKSSSVWLVHDSTSTQGFTYATSELVKAGTVSGFIVGEKPSWISVRVSAQTMHDVANGTFPFHP